MNEKRRRFSEEFKREATRLAFEGSRPVAEVGRELDVRPDMLRRWRRKLSGEGVGVTFGQVEAICPATIRTVHKSSWRRGPLLWLPPPLGVAIRSQAVG